MKCYVGVLNDEIDHLYSIHSHILLSPAECLNTVKPLICERHLCDFFSAKNSRKFIPRK